MKSEDKKADVNTEGAVIAVSGITRYGNAGESKYTVNSEDRLRREEEEKLGKHCILQIESLKCELERGPSFAQPQPPIHFVIVFFACSSCICL